MRFSFEFRPNRHIGNVRTTPYWGHAGVRLIPPTPVLPKHLGGSGGPKFHWVTHRNRTPGASATLGVRRPPGPANQLVLAARGHRSQPDS